MKTESKRKSQTVFTPVWAQVIEVKREDDALLVRGWGHIPFHMSAGDVEPQQIAGIDLLEQFRRSALTRLSAKKGDNAAGIYQFADATDDDKIIAFVKEFGPIAGRVLHDEVDSEFGTKTLTVREEVAQLSRHHKIFCAATDLLGELNRNGRADPKVIVNAMMTIYPAPKLFLPQDLPTEIDNLTVPARPGTSPDVFNPWTWSMLAVRELIEDSTNARQRIVGYGHHALCQLLNCFPLSLVPADGRQPIELPKIKREGIIDSLYYKLRLDYLAQRQLGVCLNCNGHFPIMRRGARACGDECARVLRNRKYWEKNHKKLNKKRTKKNK